MKANRLNTLAALAAALVFSVPLQSHAAEHMDKMDMNISTTDRSEMTEGEVRKIDKDAGKITLKHGPITNLNMPGMTMAFRTADPAILDQIKEGDKVKFHVEKINGILTITHIEPYK